MNILAMIHKLRYPNNCKTINSHNKIKRDKIGKQFYLKTQKIDNTIKQNQS